MSSNCDSARKRKELKRAFENKEYKKKPLINEDKSKLLKFDRFNEKVEVSSTIS